MLSVADGRTATDWPAKAIESWRSPLGPCRTAVRAAVQAAVVADAADDVVIEIHQLGQVGRHGALAHQVAAGRHVAVEGVVRPLVFVMTAPAVEPGLSGFDVQEAAALQELGLHGAVHALDLAHRLRVAGPASTRA